MIAEMKFPNKPVLIVDDEEQFLYSINLTLHANGINNVITSACGKKAEEYISQIEFSVIILDIKLPDMRGTELLDIIIDRCPEVPVIMITAVNQADVAVECMKKGAVDYLVKPFEEDKLIRILKNSISQRELRGENEALKSYLLGSGLKRPEAFKMIVTDNKKMYSLFQYVEAIASTPFPVLITGETGTGKELFAQAIHSLSGRKGEFVTVNVAGIDENTFSDTLFGHVKGAFTGAERSRPGLIEQAAGGTLFLDEIGDLCKGSQVKLLRVIQNRDYLPLGADVSKLADVRIVVATNKSLDELKLEGQFRSDLFHRLRTHHIAIPPLRERMDDVPLLLDSFLTEASAILNKHKPGVPKNLLSLFNNYKFPGNVRELRSMVFDAVSIDERKELSVNIFEERLGIPLTMDIDRSETIVTDQSYSIFRPGSNFPTIREAIQSLIAEALHQSNGSQNTAARMLGISPQALSRRLKYMKKNIDEE